MLNQYNSQKLSQQSKEFAMKINRLLIVLGTSAILAACGSGGTNEAPQFSQAAHNFNVDEDQSVLGSVSATDNEQISYTVANAASDGVFALDSDGSFTYTPNENFNGKDSVQVQASDGNSTSLATIRFDVAAVNDEPVLETTFINVTTSSETVTILSATDVDNDKVTFALIQAPESGELTLTESGEVTFTGRELEAVTGSFVVSCTDGNIAEPIEAKIDLKAALTTNSDKLAYYYSSNHSHLAKAENIKAELVDDVAREKVNVTLAEGYYVAGLENKAEETINEIISVQTKSFAYRRAALALDLRQKFELANQLRAKSEENYNLYMVEKGLDNISSSDASYYLTLNNNYIDAGQIEQAEQLMVRVLLFANAVRREEYSSTYGRFLSAFNFNAEAAVESYFNERTDENYEKAVQAIQYLADLSAQTGYRLETRGEYEGLPTDRIKALYVTWAAEYFFNISAIEEAKEYMALALSLYGQVGYDESFTYPISPYSDATTSTYQYPLELLTGLYAGLYPEEESNLALNVLIGLGDENDIADAQSTRFAYQIVYAIQNGISVAEAIQPAVDYFVAEDDYRTLYQTLVEYRHVYPRAATLLFANDEVESARTLLNLASDILTSTEYVDDVKSNTYVTGWLGCNRLAELQQLYGGDAAAQAEKCMNLVNTHYTKEANKFSSSAIFNAHRDLMETLNKVNQTEGITATADTMLAMTLADEDLEVRLDAQVEVANYLNKYGLFEKAQSTINEALATVDLMIATDEAAEVEGALGILVEHVLEDDESSTGYSWNHAYMYGIKHNITNINDYSSHYAINKANVAAKVQSITNKALTFSNEDVQDMMEDLVTANFRIGEIDKVNELIALTINGAADELDLKTIIAELYSEQEDLPGANIASVDTDKDGMPNFFIAEASKEDIVASGLTLDEDSDNDGVADSEDNTPLGDN